MVSGVCSTQLVTVGARDGRGSTRGGRTEPARDRVAGCSVSGRRDLFNDSVDAHFVRSWRSPPGFPRRAFGVSTICLFSDRSKFLFRAPAFPCALLAPPPSPTPILSSRLPKWPPSVGVFCCWTVGTKRLQSGERSTHLPRGRRQSED